MIKNLAKSTEQPGEAESAAADQSVPENAENPARSAKLQERRHKWRWNLPLVLWSSLVAAVVLCLAAISYNYHSRTAGNSFLTLAEEAAATDDYARQIKWLNRYSLLHPGDEETIKAVGIAADKAADAAAPERRFQAVDNARKRLGEAIARLGEDDAEIKADLRARLIERLLQLGPLAGQWLIEAERQVILLAAEPNDPRATRWLALALMGQVNSAIYQKRDPGPIGQNEHYWKWLADQNPGRVLLKAMERNPDDLDLMGSFLESVRQRPEIFKSTDDAASEAGWERGLDERLEQVLTALKSRSDSRSRLMLYAF
mgnify:FL=1